jgi:hypothetical protein
MGRETFVGILAFPFGAMVAGLKGEGVVSGVGLSYRVYLVVTPDHFTLNSTQPCPCKLSQ